MEENAIQDFSDLISARMADGKSRNPGEWEKSEILTDRRLLWLLFKAVKDSDWGSVGAYAMMASQRGLKYDFTLLVSDRVGAMTFDQNKAEDTDATKHD